MRTRWIFDLWSDDDPAVVRGREALALRPPQTPQETPGDPEGIEDDPEAVPLPAPTRRDRIAQLAARIRAGDLGAVAQLRELLER